MKGRFRTTVLAAGTILLVAGAWTALSTASRSSEKNPPTVNPLSVFVRDAGVASIPNKHIYSVAPGAVEEGDASCPKDSRTGNTLNDWFVVGGGYHMYGVDGATVASATAAYPSDTTQVYKVTVANPKLAASTVTFAVEATCLDVKTGPLGT